MKTSITPPGTEAMYQRFHFSPAMKANGFVFVSGQLGLGPDGRPAEGAAAQIDLAFQAIGRILEAAGGSFASIVELGSFHVGPLGEQMPAFIEAIARHVGEPYPAWTAVGVTGLAVPGALVEVRATAQL